MILKFVMGLVWVVMKRPYSLYNGEAYGLLLKSEVSR